MGKNIFIEGVPGTGKSTLLSQIAQKHPQYQAYREGDLSPVELAWCSYMTKSEWEAALHRYPDFEKEILDRTKVEDSCGGQSFLSGDGAVRDLQRESGFSNVS